MFTLGDHIVFGASQYSPGRPEGRFLPAPELIHTFQQRGATCLIQRSEVGSAADLDELAKLQDSWWDVKRED